MGTILQHLRGGTASRPCLPPVNHEEMTANFLAAALHNYRLAKSGRFEEQKGVLDLTDVQQSFYLEWFIPRIVDPGFFEL